MRIVYSRSRRKASCSPFAELAGPGAELMAAVACGIRFHSRQHAIPAQDLHRYAIFREPEKVREVVGPSQELRFRHRCRLYARVARVRDRPRHVDARRIARQLADEAVLEGDAQAIPSTMRKSRSAPLPSAFSASW